MFRKVLIIIFFHFDRAHGLVLRPCVRGVGSFFLRAVLGVKTVAWVKLCYICSVHRGVQEKEKSDTFSICACHPCAGAMLIFSVSFQF